MEKIGRIFPVLMERCRDFLNDHNLEDNEQFIDFSASYFVGNRSDRLREDMRGIRSCYSILMRNCTINSVSLNLERYMRSGKVRQGEISEKDHFFNKLFISVLIYFKKSSLSI